MSVDESVLREMHGWSRLGDYEMCGRLHPGREHSARIQAEFVDCGTGEVFRRDVDLVFDGEVIRMFGGPTGSESFRLGDDTAERMSERGWLACFGTPGRYDRCEVDASEMRRAFATLRVG